LDAVAIYKRAGDLSLSEVVRKKRNVEIGDLVMPIREEEFLFLSPEGAVDPLEIDWDRSSIGIVLQVVDFNPPRQYKRVRVVVDGLIGWTYSDYLEPIVDEPRR
jgi:hypothetical protein